MEYIGKDPQFFGGPGSGRRPKGGGKGRGRKKQTREGAPYTVATSEQNIARRKVGKKRG